MGSEAHRDVGMIVCVGRKDEARALAADLDALNDRLAIFTADPDCNKLGGAAPDDAQVLVTTQQMLERRCRGAFATAREFHYRGKPRAVRAWDEGYLTGVPLSLNRDAIAGLFEALRPRFPRMTDAVEDLFLRLRSVPDDDLLAIPDWEADYGVPLSEALSATETRVSGQQTSLTALYMLAGRMARVRHDGPTGNAMVSYQDTLPTDLAPMLVLDASGRVRHTYNDMATHRGNIHRLHSATKDYAPLTVAVWHTAGSKSGWQRRGPELVTGIATTILTKPDEDWLVVHHKHDRRVLDVAREVASRLPTTTAAKVHYLTWGQHQATNAFCDVGNVILAGSLFYRLSHTAALTYLAQGKPVHLDKLRATEIEQTVIGEHRHLLLQAGCRGRVRKLNGGQAHPMDLFVIAAPTSGIAAALGDVFPGCQVRKWEPLPRTLKGHLKAAVDYTEAALAQGIEWVSYTAIRQHCGIDQRNFGSLISKQPDWLDAVASAGAEIVRGKRGALGVRLVPDAAIG